MMSTLAEFDTTRLEFDQLLRQDAFPPKMELKLRFLQASSLGQSTENFDLNELPEFEQLALSQMDQSSKISLFCSIVKCFSGSQELQYFSLVPSRVKKEQSFSSWVHSLLSCDGRHLSLYKAKSQQIWHLFAIEKLWVSKQTRLHKNRHIFGIAYEKVKYLLGFEDSTTCQRIHSSLIDRIRNLKSARDRRNSFASDVDYNRSLQFEKEEAEYEQRFEQQRLLQQEKDFLARVQQECHLQQLKDDSKFRLVKNIPNGRIIEHEGQFKVCLLVERCAMEQLISRYLELMGWNQCVESVEMVSRIRKNTFLTRLRLKKANFASYPREALISVTYLRDCACLNSKNLVANNSPKNSKHLLAIRTQKGEISPGYVEMDFSQTIEVSQVQQDSNMVFLIALTRIDFNGYAYLSNNYEQTFAFVSQIASLPRYYIEKQLMGSSTSPFQFDYCVCQEQHAPSKSSFYSQAGSVIHSSLDPHSPSKLQTFKTVTPLNDILQALRDSFRFQKNELLQKIIRQKLYESYYLHHHFWEKEEKGEWKEITDFLLQGNRWRLQNGQYIFCDEEGLKAQKSILKLILKQMTTNLMAGKSIMNMSLPVEIFDKVSGLELLASNLGFVPAFARKAVAARNTVEQIKWVAMAFMFNAVTYPNIEKPFNPILGETFQSTIGGIPVYLQQISHHPPISSFLMKGEQFEAWGNIDVHIDMGLNSAYSKITELLHIKFHGLKTEYIIKLPDVQVGGLMLGDRTYHLVTKGFVYEQTNDIYLEFSIGKDKKKVYEYPTKISEHDLAGGVFKVTHAFGQKLMRRGWGKKFEGVKPDEVIEKYSLLSGKWYGDVRFDEVVYKTVKEGPFPVRQVRPEYLLPSDPLFRLDIMFKMWGNNQRSNEQKEVLQNIQRRDRKLREEYYKKK